MLSHNFKLNFESDEEDDSVIRKKFEFNQTDEDEDDEDDHNIVKKTGDTKSSKSFRPNFFDSDEEVKINKGLENKDKNISIKADSNNTSNIF